VIVHLPHLAPLWVTGKDTRSFLQGLITNDIFKPLPLYSCLLTPQGKFLHDFIVLAHHDEGMWLVAEKDRLHHLTALLKKYILRATVTLTPFVDILIYTVLEGPIPPALATGLDPRHAHLGTLIVSSTPIPYDKSAFSIWDNRRIALCIPDGSRDMIPEQALMLENHIDTLGGVDFHKGCYMGQELTARTKYRGLIKKHLYTVTIKGTPPPWNTPLLLEGKEVGWIRSTQGNMGLALIRDDAAMHTLYPLHHQDTDIRTTVHLDH
jgi:tRNA-modifying protein YgfZ